MAAQYGGGSAPTSGTDERGRELEIVAAEVQGARDPEAVMLVLHVMPTHYRKEPS